MWRKSISQGEKRRFWGVDAVFCEEVELGCEMGVMAVWVRLRNCDVAGCFPD